jgi:hypothetical protein
MAGVNPGWHSHRVQSPLPPTHQTHPQHPIQSIPGKVRTTGSPRTIKRIPKKRKTNDEPEELHKDLHALILPKFKEINDLTRDGI